MVQLMTCVSPYVTMRASKNGGPCPCRASKTNPRLSVRRDVNHLVDECNSKNSEGTNFCSSSTRIFYVPRPLQRPVPGSFLKECCFRKCSTSSKWSISPSRCGDHRQYFGMDRRIYHIRPPHMGVNTTTYSLVFHRTCCYFSPRGQIALSWTFPSVSARTLESAFFPRVFHGLSSPPQKVRRSPGTTS